MKRIVVLLLFGLLLIGLKAEGYQLEELIETGMQNASSIIRSEISRDNAYSSHTSSWLSFLPDVNASYGRVRSLSYSDNNANNNNGSKYFTWDDENKDYTTSESSSYGISKSISLNEGDYFHFRNTLIDKKVADINMDIAKKDLAYTIIEFYLNILQAQKTLEIQEENLALQERVLAEIAIQVQQGRKTTIDLNQADIDKIDSEIQIENLTNSLKNMRANLFNMLRINDNGSEFSDVAIAIEPTESLPSYEEIVPDSKNNPFSFRIDYLNLKSMKINEWQYKLNFLPTITLSASQKHSSVTDEPLKYDTKQQSYSLGISASYSLWNFFNQRENYRRYKNSMRLTELSIEDNISDYKSQYNQLMRNLEYLHKAKDLYERKVQQSNENLSVANEKYTLGLIDLIELDRSRISNLQARISQNENFYSILKSQEQLNKLLSLPIMGRW